MNPPLLNERRILAALAGQSIGHDVQVHAELASTSDLARDLGWQGYPSGLVVFAEEQTSGRGRRANRWSSPPGENLLFSILLRPEEINVAAWPRLTTLAALALSKAIEKITDLQPMIKWPNDVYLDGRKVAGILAESFRNDQGAFMILGIGLNVNSSSFPADLEKTAISLKQAGGAPVERERVAIALLQELNAQCARWDEGFQDVLAEVRARSWLLGRAVRVSVQGQEVQGQAVDLSAEGHLVLLTSNGEKKILSSVEQVRAL